MSDLTVNDLLLILGDKEAQLFVARRDHAVLTARVATLEAALDAAKNPPGPLP